MTAVAIEQPPTVVPTGFRACRVCGVHFEIRKRDARGVVVELRPRQCCPLHTGSHAWTSEGVAVDGTTPYAQDVGAQLFVSAFPDGASADFVGEAIGRTHSRVQQIEAIAMRKLRDGLLAAGISRQDVRDYLASIVSERAQRPSRGPYKPRVVETLAEPVSAPPSTGPVSEHGRAVDVALAELEAVLAGITDLLDRAGEGAVDAS